MMNLKQHNDIVQKLLTQINSKQSEIKELNKKLMKMSKQTSANHNPKLQQTQTQRNLNKKILQLTKQHKDRVNQITQQLRSKSTQNKQLKQRLSIKNNLQVKQKERIVEVMKKTIHNGVNNQYDHKIAALVSHYQEQSQKKQKFIQTLKRQIKSLSLSQLSKKQPQTESKQNTQSQNISIQAPQKNTISILAHKEEVSKLNWEIQKLNKLYESKDAQYKSIGKKYADLTKQYYRVLNEYGVDQPNAFIKSKAKYSSHQANKNTSYQSSHATALSLASKVSNFSQQAKRQNPLGNLLHQMLIQENSDCDSSISVTFEQNFKKFNNRPKLQDEELQQQQRDINQVKNNQNQIEFSNLIQEIMEILHLQNKNDIIPYLHNLSIKNKEIQIYDAITRSLHSFFYKFGMGKISKTDLIQTLEVFEVKVNKYVENSQLLDEICIEVGSKRQALKNKILQLKQIHNQYLNHMRNIAFIKQLHKSNKVVQFIQFFQLDASDLILPEQLKNVYQQLKFVDKFLKMANTILGFQGEGIQKGLDNILNKLQSYEHNKQLAEKKTKKRNNETIK